jgi:transposase-like protein
MIHRFPSGKMVYSSEFKRHAVQITIDEKLTLAQAADRFKISPASMHRWLSHYRLGLTPC